MGKKKKGSAAGCCFPEASGTFWPQANQGEPSIVNEGESPAYSKSPWVYAICSRRQPETGMQGGRCGTVGEGFVGSFAWRIKRTERPSVSQEVQMCPTES